MREGGKRGDVEEPTSMVWTEIGARVVLETEGATAGTIPLPTEYAQLSASGNERLFSHCTVQARKTITVVGKQYRRCN